ncbi:MAG: DUF3494 domain-containing protein, partial [Paludibacter sp.]|nr:DUF3494 domain-containing protein [Paludibacter sp.]
MKKHQLNLVLAVLLFLMPVFLFGQAPPTLGTTSSFALFTASGAFSNVGASTTVTGDVGTNVGAFSAFPPGTLVGQQHVADATSAQAATDVATAYSSLNQGGVVISVGLGGQTLTPGVYSTGAASTLNGTLTLDGQGNSNAIFIIRIGGALSTGISSNVSLIGSASLCNVYWQIGGALTLGDNSVFKGTAIVDGAIHLLEGSSLQGRALSTAGAIDLHNNVVTVTTDNTIALSVPGTNVQTICINTPITNITYTSTGATGATFTGLPAGVTGSFNGNTVTISGSPTTATGSPFNYTVTLTGGCGSATANGTITVNAPTAPIVGTITQPTCDVATGSVVLSGLPAGDWTINPGAIAGSTTSTTISGLAPGTYNYTVTNAAGCISVASVNVVINALPATPSAPIVGTITQPTCLVATGSVVLSGLPAGNWTINPGAITGSTTSITISGLAPGTYNYTVTNA